jgi:hypothetical protein
MLQGYALNTAGNSQIWILDLAPDRNVSIEPNGRRWEEGDPVPMRVLMDYHTGCECCERNPQRYRVERMPDDEYATLVKASEESREGRS